MKRILAGIVCCGLCLMFLIYAGVFRNNADPLAVTEFYYQCMRNWEWFLYVPMYDAQTFNYEKEEADYMQHKMFMLRRVDLSVLREGADNCDVDASLIFKDGRSLQGTVNLVRERDRWLITRVSYE